MHCGVRRLGLRHCAFNGQADCKKFGPANRLFADDFVPIERTCRSASIDGRRNGPAVASAVGPAAQYCLRDDSGAMLNRRLVATQSGMAPPLKLATVPVIALAWSDTRNAAALASSASVVRRLR